MQRTCTHSPLRRWLFSFLFCEREKIWNLEEKLCTLSECIFRISVYRRIKLYQWKLDSFKSTDKSDCMLPSSCQNKGNTKIKCLKGAFGVITATRTVSVWLGSGCASGSTPLEGCHNILRQVLLFFWILLEVLEKAFNRCYYRMVKWRSIQGLEEFDAY